MIEDKTRVADGYFIPGVGAFDGQEGPEAFKQFDAFADPERPFHIGQGYEHEVARMIACAHCHGTSFEVGIGSYFTALRCLGCGREWCQHSG